MALKDMKLTAEEAKDENYCYPTTAADDDDKGPRYPYGLELCIRDESMKKLGIGLIPVGTEIMVIAKAVITGTSSRERVGGETHQDMDIQITALDLGPIQMDAYAAAATKLYNK